MNINSTRRWLFEKRRNLRPDVVSEVGQNGRGQLCRVHRVCRTREVFAKLRFWFDERTKTRPQVFPECLEMVEVYFTQANGNVVIR